MPSSIPGAQPPPQRALAAWLRSHAWFRARAHAIVDAAAAGESVPPHAYAEFGRALDRHSRCEERTVFATLPPEDRDALTADHVALEPPSHNSGSACLAAFAMRVLSHLDEEESVVARARARALGGGASAPATPRAGWDAAAAALGIADDDATRPPPGSHLRALALSVLREPDADAKAARTIAIARAYADGDVVIDDNDGGGGDDDDVPASPARPAGVREVDPRRMRGARSVRASVHSVVHAENYAIDLSWDIIARFGWRPASWTLAATASGRDGGGASASTHVAATPTAAVDAAAPPPPPPPPPVPARLPPSFFDDWVRVAAEEAVHYLRWRDRLAALGGRYGEFEAHGMLWEAAAETAHSLLARLAIVHCVHEARGLDTSIAFAARLAAAGDADSAAVLRANHEDEITHVAAGRRWLECVCETAGEGGAAVAPMPTFQALCRALHRGGLKPPFNEASRDRAGLTREWWGPLVVDSAVGPPASPGAPGSCGASDHSTGEPRPTCVTVVTVTAGMP